MTDQNKQAKTAPPLLLIGTQDLSFEGSPAASILMPVPHHDSSGTLSDGGEEDSFVGQMSTSSQTFQLFGTPIDSASAPDPFESISQPPLFTSVPQAYPLFTTPAGSSRYVSPIPAASTSLYNLPTVPSTPANNVSHGGTRPTPGRYHYATTQLPPNPPAIPASLLPIVNHNHPAPPSMPPAAKPAKSYDNKRTSGPMEAGPVLNLEPVRHHWFYCMVKEGRDIWWPFSSIDSKTLEEAFLSADPDKFIVNTDGGRFEVDLSEHSRRPIYWDDPPLHVRRCSWFFKPEGENHLVPYEENFASRLEEEYLRTVHSGMFHKKLDFPGGDVIVIHNVNVIVHYPPSAQPDEWGMTNSDQPRPLVVKRGPEDCLAYLPEGEPAQVDHLVFVVHGIGPTCDLRFRNIVECVDDMRQISLRLLDSHFRTGPNQSNVGRVEFLPVRWHEAVHGDATGVDNRLKSITLSSIYKLRHFTNDTLLDVLFYFSPVYAQKICDTVVEEINRLYKLFCMRNPTFKKSVSLVGHSMGSLILFDLLAHQPNPLTISQSGTVLRGDRPFTAAGDSTSGSSEPFEVVSRVSESDEDEEGFVENIDDMLDKLGLSGLKEIFEKEQMDLDTLVYHCEETDIKDIGIPLGPRKKLLGFIKAYRGAQERQQAEERLRKAQQLQDKVMEYKLKKQTQVYPDSIHSDPVMVTASETSVNFVVGSHGAGVPLVNYAHLAFNPVNFYALGSPISMILTVRGVQSLGDEFHFPTCPGFFNIFHPFDPVAYRMEPLLVPTCPPKAVLMPHHKGRKRLHLELRDSLSRMGADIKQRFLDSVRSTWRSLSQFAAAHRGNLPADMVEAEVKEVFAAAAENEESGQGEDTDSVTSSAVEDDDLLVSGLNQGRRVDFVLQEAPLESFNDYLFALGSHTCYWQSEDTVLMILKETYSGLDVHPIHPRTELWGKNEPSGATVPTLPIGSRFAGFNTQQPPGSSLLPPPPPPHM